MAEQATWLGEPITTEELQKRIRMWKAFESTRYARDALRVLSRLEQLMDLLEQLSNHDVGPLFAAWEKAGVGPYDPDDDVQGEQVEQIENVTVDASGFLWACHAFHGMLQSYTPETERQRRRRLRSREKNL